MGKEKKIKVHTFDKYPSDLNKLFEQFKTIFLEVMELELISQKISEVGPQSGIYPTFKIDVFEFQIGFEIQNSKLILNFVGIKRMLRDIKSIIIRCAEKAIESFN